MGGDKPKVLYEVAGLPMVTWVVRACRAAGVGRCVIVVGYKGDAVREALRNEPDCEFVDQTEQLGTGHAAQMAAPLFTHDTGDVFVLAGDGPLIRAATLEQLLETHRLRKADATIATSVIDDPTGYGRVVRDPHDGDFMAIVEQKDASERELAIREVNPSYYCFRAAALFEALARVRNDNKQGEYYLTDVPGLLKSEGRPVAVVDAVPPEDVLSINTPEQLNEVDRILQERIGEPTSVEGSAS